MASGLVWTVFSHWHGSPHMWRMDFVEDPGAFFSSLLPSHYEALVVIKAFETVERKQAELEQRFQHFHRKGRWYAALPALRRFVEEEATCETLEAKRLFDFPSDGRLVWRPVRADKQKLLEEAKENEVLPRFVNNAQRFVLWAIDDLATSGYHCSSKEIVHHPANASLYQSKTIYNALSRLMEDGKVLKTQKRELILSDAAKAEIDGLARVWEIKEKKRVKTLRIN